MEKTSNILQELLREENLLVTEIVVIEEQSGNFQVHCRFKRSIESDAEVSKSFKVKAEGLTKNEIESIFSHPSTEIILERDPIQTRLGNVLNMFVSLHSLVVDKTVCHWKGKRLVIEEDLFKEKFICASETDPEGITFGKCVAILRTLAVYHAASSTFDEVQKTESSHLPDDFECITAKVALEKVHEFEQLFVVLNRKGAFPQVLNVCDFRPQNVLLRYRGCGMWDLRLKRVQNYEGSPIVDILYFFVQCFPSWKDGQVDDCLELYFSRFSEVSEILQKPLQLKFLEFKDEVKTFLSFLG